jgi:hypothetical protein
MRTLTDSELHAVSGGQQSFAISFTHSGGNEANVIGTASGISGGSETAVVSGGTNGSASVVSLGIVSNS